MSETRGHKRSSRFSRLGELFDASAMGLVTLLLLVASFFATWRGMSDFITSHDLVAGAASKGLVLLIVVTLSLAMYVALRELVSPYYASGWWAAIWKRVVAGILYAVLAIWSVGFGYGFWWSLVAGQDATETALQRTVASLDQESSNVRARLGAAGSVMASAEQLSDAKADREAAEGGTCGVNSPAGTGPLARARSETQVQIAALAASVRDDWQAPLDARLSALAAELENALAETKAADRGESVSRKARFEALGRDTQTAAREIGADAIARGRVFAAQLRAKANQLSLPPENGRVAYCYDPDLAAALYAASNELAQTYTIEVTGFQFAEGPDGVARAIETLFEGGLKLAGFQAGAVSAGMALKGRDLIALLATIGVDLALFVFALLRGGSGRGREAGRVQVQPARKEDEDALEALLLEDKRDELVLGVPEQTALLMLSNGDEDETEADDKEFAPIALRTKTFEPESQEQIEDRIAGLLDRVEQHMMSIEAASSTSELTRLRNMQADALRELRSFGFMDTGASDKTYDEHLHEAVEHAHSDKPEGHIARVVRPRFMDAEGRLRLRARVIVSLGPEGGDWKD